MSCIELRGPLQQRYLSCAGLLVWDVISESQVKVLQEREQNPIKTGLTGCLGLGGGEKMCPRKLHSLI